MKKLQQRPQQSLEIAVKRLILIYLPLKVFTYTYRFLANLTQH